MSHQTDALAFQIAKSHAIIDPQIPHPPSDDGVRLHEKKKGGVRNDPTDPWVGGMGVVGMRTRKVTSFRNSMP